MVSASANGTYWTTSISKVTDEKVFIRGYDLEDLIGRLPFTATAFLLIRGRIPTPAECRVLDGVLSAVLDYSFNKPGTVAARFAVSASPSMAAGLAAGCLSVGKHTLATEDTGRFIVDSYERYKTSGLDRETFARERVAELRATRQRIPGLGHPVFKRVDPRGELLKQIAVAEGFWTEEAQLYEEMHRAFVEQAGKPDIPINDVGVMAAVLVGLGFTPDEGTGLAVLSTIPGLIAHVSEELRSNRPIRVIPDDLVTTQLPSDRALERDLHEAGWPSRAGIEA